MKFAKKTFLAALLIFAAAVVGMIVCIPVEGQSVSQQKHTVVFRFRPQANNIQAQPEVRIYVLVDGTTEGEAAINAHKFISEKLTTNAQENLVYLECQKK